MRSIRGRGKLSFGQARLMSVKSMQSHHFPFSFSTRTCSQLVGIIYFSDSSGLEEFVDLFVNRLLPLWGELILFYLTGLKEWLTFSLWVITVGLIPSMSSCFQENTSTFCFKKWMRRSLTS